MRTGGESQLWFELTEHECCAASPVQGRNERVLVPRSLTVAGNGVNRTRSEFE
jgi:hypothetical protein